MMKQPLRLGFIMALVGLATALVGMVYMNPLYVILSFYFALCWFVWLACTLLPGKRKAIHLLMLWLLIDVAIFVQFLALERSFGHRLSGDEFIWAISYAPVIFPTGLIYALVFDDAIQNILTFGQLFGPTFGYVLGNWVGFSLIAAAQSLLVVSGALVVKNLYRTLTIRSSRTRLRRAP